MPTVLHTARILCSMLRPPQRDGGALVTGERLLAVGEAARLRRDADRVVPHDGVLLPGLVDARTRVEDSDPARRGVHALLRSGVAANGDVVSRGPGVPACARAGLVGDSWLAVAGVDRREHDAVLAAVARSLALPAGGRRVGLAPQPLALGTGVLQALSVLAAARRAPVHLAVGRDLAEREALAGASGDLAEAARAAGWEFEWLEAPAGKQPLAYLDALGLLTPRTSVACPRDVTQGEASLLARRRSAVVCCEASPGARGADAPLERFAEAGTPLALGSDGGVDVLAAATAWVALARRRGLARWPGPAGPLELAEAAIRLATVDGAGAMGWGEDAGVLAAGRRADFVVLDLDTTPERAYADVADRGAGRQVLTVLAGVRRARRASAEVAWPPVPPGEEPGGEEEQP